MSAWKGVPEDVTSPPRNGAAVTPNDSTDLDNWTRAINVATPGTVRVTTVGTEYDAGDTIDLYVAAGIAFPIRARRILATGTTATGIVALY